MQVKTTEARTMNEDDLKTAKSVEYKHIPRTFFIHTAVHKSTRDLTILSQQCLESQDFEIGIS